MLSLFRTNQRIFCLMLAFVAGSGCGRSPSESKSREQPGDKLPLSSDTLVYGKKTLTQWIQQLESESLDERARAVAVFEDDFSFKRKTTNSVLALSTEADQKHVRAELKKVLPLIHKACLDGCRQHHAELRTRSCKVLFGYRRNYPVPRRTLIATLFHTPVLHDERSSRGPVPLLDSCLHLCRVVQQLRKLGPPAKVAIPALKLQFEALGQLRCGKGSNLKEEFDKGIRINSISHDALYFYSVGGSSKLNRRQTKQLKQAVERIGYKKVIALRLIEDLSIAIDEFRPWGFSEFKNAVKSSNPDIRAAAVEAVGFLGQPRATAVISELRQLLQTGDAHLRYHSAIALVSIDQSEALNALPVALSALRGRADTSENRVARIKKTVAVLISVLRTQRASRPRVLAVKILGEIGPDALPAIDDIRALLGSEQVALRSPAAAALKKIRKKK